MTKRRPVFHWSSASVFDHDREVVRKRERFWRDAGAVTVHLRWTDSSNLRYAITFAVDNGLTLGVNFSPGHSGRLPPGRQPFLTINTEDLANELSLLRTGLHRLATTIGAVEDAGDNKLGTLHFFYDQEKFLRPPRPAQEMRWIAWHAEIVLLSVRYFSGCRVHFYESVSDHYAPSPAEIVMPEVYNSRMAALYRPLSVRLNRDRAIAAVIKALTPEGGQEDVVLAISLAHGYDHRYHVDESLGGVQTIEPGWRPGQRQPWRWGWLIESDKQLALQRCERLCRMFAAEAPHAQDWRLRTVDAFYLYGEPSFRGSDGKLTGRVQMFEQAWELFRSIVLGLPTADDGERTIKEPLDFARASASGMMMLEDVAVSRLDDEPEKR